MCLFRPRLGAGTQSLLPHSICQNQLLTDIGLAIARDMTEGGMKNWRHFCNQFITHISLIQVNACAEERVSAHNPNLLLSSVGSFCYKYMTDWVSSQIIRVICILSNDWKFEFQLLYASFLTFTIMKIPLFRGNLEKLYADHIIINWSYFLKDLLFFCSH